jgi:hypothetical protein
MGNQLCRPSLSKISCEGFREEQTHLQLSEWDDECSFHHRSAINCVRNFALGKTSEEYLCCVQNPIHDKQRQFKPIRALRFSDTIESIDFVRNWNDS